MKNHYLVAYDVCDNKRRRRLLKVLEDYAYRVQYSVFEMCVGESELKKIQNWIEKVINKKEDSVLIYELGALAIKNRINYGIVSNEEKNYNSSYMCL